MLLIFRKACTLEVFFILLQKDVSIIQKKVNNRFLANIIGYTHSISKNIYKANEKQIKPEYFIPISVVSADNSNSTIKLSIVSLTLPKLTTCLIR